MYNKTIRELEKRFKEKFPGLEPNRRIDERYLPEHLLFMLSQIEKIDDQLKASRWIGWVQALAVNLYGIITDEEIDNLTREDIKK